MKNILKKLFLPLLMISLVFTITGCAEEPLNFEVREDVMQMITMKIIGEYYNTSEVEQVYYLNEGTDLQKTAVSGFLAAESTDHVGNFVRYQEGEGSVEFSNGVDGKVLCSQYCKYENRVVKVTVSYKQNLAYEIDKQRLYDDFNTKAYNNGLDISTYIVNMYGGYDMFDMSSMEAFLESYLAEVYQEYPYIPEDCEVSAVYSKGELIANAGKNTAIGMGVVFIVLIFISFIISLLKYLPMLFDAEVRKANAEKKKAQEEAKKQTEERIISSNDKEEKVDLEKEIPAAAPAVSSDSENLVNDEELVAVITAAIYAATGMKVRGPAYTASNDKLVVRSIRRAR